MVHYFIFGFFHSACFFFKDSSMFYVSIVHSYFIADSITLHGMLMFIY